MLFHFFSLTAFSQTKKKSQTKTNFLIKKSNHECYKQINSHSWRQICSTCSYEPPVIILLQIRNDLISVTIWVVSVSFWLQRNSKSFRLFDRDQTMSKLCLSSSRSNWMLTFQYVHQSHRRTKVLSHRIPNCSVKYCAENWKLRKKCYLLFSSYSFNKKCEILEQPTVTLDNNWEMSIMKFVNNITTPCIADKQ